MYGNDSKQSKVRTGRAGHNCYGGKEDCELKIVVCTKIKIWMPLFLDIAKLIDTICSYTNFKNTNIIKYISRMNVFI